MSDKKNLQCTRCLKELQPGDDVEVITAAHIDDSGLDYERDHDEDVLCQECVNTPPKTVGDKP
jgi:hypothetical protein